MPKIHQIIKYMDYWLNAVDKHSLQAPYIYELYNSVIRNNYGHAGFALIERLRKQLQQSTNTISVVDFGAGSHVTQHARRAIRDIATKGITKKKYSEFIYRLGEHIEATNIVELGTSLGINTLYLSLIKHAEITTFEGSSSLYNLAREIFQDLNKTNINTIEGNIDKQLPEFLATSAPIDLAFIDANHRYAPTMNYFDLLSTKAHRGSCFIFDDIHWSKDMEKAWTEIKNHYTVTLSIDLYQMGLIFFNPDLRKQDYVLQL